MQGTHQVGVHQLRQLAPAAGIQHVDGVQRGAAEVLADVPASARSRTLHAGSRLSPNPCLNNVTGDSYPAWLLMCSTGSVWCACMSACQCG